MALGISIFYLLKGDSTLCEVKRHEETPSVFIKESGICTPVLCLGSRAENWGPDAWQRLRVEGLGFRI